MRLSNTHRKKTYAPNRKEAEQIPETTIDVATIL